MATVVHVISGSVLGLVSFCIFCLALCVIYAFVRNGFLREGQNSVYVLLFANVVSDAMHVSLLAFYLSPSTIIQTWIFPGGVENGLNKAVGILCLTTWYQAITGQVIMAVNRVVLVVFPSWSSLFNRRNAILFAAMIFPISAALALVSDLALPCCTIYLYYYTFGYFYLGDGENYANAFVDVPVDAFCSAVAMSSYGLIFVYVFVTRKRISATMGQSTKKQQWKEVRYTLQFAILASILLFEWSSMRVFPLILPADIPEINVITTYLMLIHCASNSVVMLTVNQEFKSKFWGCFSRRQVSIAVSISSGAGTREKSK